MPERDVADLVRHDAREFALVVGRRNRARVDEDETAGQGERVDLFRGDDVELVREAVAGSLRRQLRAQLPDVRDDPLIVDERSLLRDLLRRLFADFYVLVRREEIETGFEVRRRTIPGARVTVRAGLVSEQRLA